MTGSVSGINDSALANAINAMSGMPSVNKVEERMSYIAIFKEEKRSEFRNIYDAIIDSTLAAMY